MLSAVDMWEILNEPQPLQNTCARRGKRQCFGSNCCIAWAGFCIVETSAPEGEGINSSLIVIRPILATLPKIKPPIIAIEFSVTERSLNEIGRVVSKIWHR
jgi:hypothetical protein